MEIIINYFKEAIKALLALFGIALDEETADNIDSMIGGLKDFKPETEAGSVEL